MALSHGPNLAYGLPHEEAWHKDMKVCLCATYMEMFVAPVSAAGSCNIFFEIAFHIYWGRKQALLYCSLELGSTNVSKFIYAHHRSHIVAPDKLGTYTLSICKKNKSEYFFKYRKDIHSSISLIIVMQLILSGRILNRVERMKALQVNMQAFEKYVLCK